MNVLQRMGPMTVPHTAVAPLERRVPATTENAAVLRRVFRAWIGEITDPDTADDLALAVYEALANAVDHAYVGSDVAGPMTLWAAASGPLGTGRDVVVTVGDEGTWRRCADPGWRGRGLPLMRELTGSIGVLSGADGTTVQLRGRVSRELARA